MLVGERESNHFFLLTNNNGGADTSSFLKLKNQITTMTITLYLFIFTYDHVYCANKILNILVCVTEFVFLSVPFSVSISWIY